MADSVNSVLSGPGGLSQELANPVKIPRDKSLEDMQLFSRHSRCLFFCRSIVPMLSVCELHRSADVHCLAPDNVDNVGVSAASAAVDHLPDICPSARDRES